MSGIVSPNRLAGRSSFPGRVLVVGGGIGGLTVAIALRRSGFTVRIIERDPQWSVYGVGIIQQSNVVRAMSHLGVLEDYLEIAYGFDTHEVFRSDGRHVATIPAPKLVEGYPATIGVTRRALQKVLAEHAIRAGATIDLGVTVKAFYDDGKGVEIQFSDQKTGYFDIVVGADGIHSATRKAIFPEFPDAEFAGQGVWRYNFKRPPEVSSLHSFEGPIGVGLVPLSETLMYMFVTTPEPGNPRYSRLGLAAAMRAKLDGMPNPIAAYAKQITDDDSVVYKPLEYVFVTGDWHKGRIVLLGDAVHATTPHLGQGAGLAIEDAIVLAEELAHADTPNEAFEAYRARRFDRAAYVARTSRALCDGQIGCGPIVDRATVMRDMFEIFSRPI